MKKITAVLLLLIMVLSLPVHPAEQKAQAASKYISVNDFAKTMVSVLGLKPGAGSTKYTDCLKDKGIIKDGDFTSYSKALTRGNLLVLINRADEYLHGDTVKAELVKTVIEKRISDISKVTVSKKDDIAKGFIKGFLKGYSNGSYSADRELKVNNKILKKDALTILKMIKNKSLRAKISPDGQLIRTTNLPNNAYMFPYILASYPNRYYEAKLRFEGVTCRVNGEVVQMKSPEDYTYPKDVAKADMYGISDLEKTKEKYLDTWLNKVYTRVWNNFNVNYKTIDDNWVETMAQTDSEIINSSDDIHYALNRYVKEMKVNKTIVECNKLAFDSSSMYYYNGFYYIRCYVHYRIVSTKTKTYYSPDELDGRLWGPYNCILYTRAAFVDLTNYKLNKWVDGIFDVGLAPGVYGDNGHAYGVCDCDWDIYLFRSYERN